MRYGLTVTSEPNSEPVPTADALAHLRVDDSLENDYITALVAAARQHVEARTNRALVTQTLQMTLDYFPGVANSILDLQGEVVGHGHDPAIRLPRSPVQSVNSITYIDDAGTTQTLAASKYDVDTSSIVPRITPAYGEVWPITRPIPNAVTVEFVAGYGAAGDVPQALKQAVLILVGTMYEHRESVVAGVTVSAVPHTFNFLIAPYRVATQAGT